MEAFARTSEYTGGTGLALLACVFSMEGNMKILLTALVVLATGGCAQAGGLGEILGGVLGGSPAAGNQVSGTVENVDTRSRLVYIRQSNGQNVGFSYDSNTQVSYQNQNYPVTALERGDEVTARYRESGNNSYYVDLIQVNRSVNSGDTGGTGSGQVYQLQGNVRSVDRSNGVFTMSTQNGGIVTVSMPYNARSTDVNRFNQLRNGDFVRILGEQLNSARFELRQFE